MTLGNLITLKYFCYDLFVIMNCFIYVMCHFFHYFFKLFSWLFSCVSLFSTVYGSLLFLYFFQCFAVFFLVGFSTLFLRVLSVFHCVFRFSKVFQVLSPVYIVSLFCWMFLIVLTSTCSLSFLQRCSLHVHFFRCCSLYLIDFPGLYVSLCTSQCFHFFQGCSLFVSCWFLFIFHTNLTITVGILNILPFLFGHFYMFIDVLKNYVFHHFVGSIRCSPFF